MERSHFHRGSVRMPGRLRIMVKNCFRHLPIADGERTIGIISLRDVVRSVVRVYPEYEDDAEDEEE
jgi:CBS domain-containing protein